MKKKKKKLDVDSTIKIESQLKKAWDIDCRDQSKGRTLQK